MELCTENKDSWEDKNYKCPYSSQELITQDNLIKHMRNKHAMTVFLYNFIFFIQIIKYKCYQLY